MCELRSYILKNDLETIDEEPDELSQNSRNGARTRSIKSLGGQSGNGNQLGVFLLNNQQQQLQHDILHSQTNTITTYATENTDYLPDFFDHHNHKMFLANSPHHTATTTSCKIRKRTLSQKDRDKAIIHKMWTTASLNAAEDRNKNGISQNGTFNGRYSRKSTDKWDLNYYYNDYAPKDPLTLYYWSNSHNYKDMVRRMKKQKNRERQGCCSKFWNRLFCCFCAH